MESVRIYKFQIYVNAHFTGRGQIYTDHTFIWNLLLKHGHSESCQPAAICITMNLDVIILVLTELSSSVVRSVGDKENGSCCTQYRELSHFRVHSWWETIFVHLQPRCAKILRWGQGTGTKWRGGSSGWFCRCVNNNKPIPKTLLKKSV